ncbi:hypothetical protein SynA18461_01299 [Synechococcus sp. A18-46.1]|nr:hypothetical protein SynA18461_01299 [Synechococcus sp. A18-46.1]
MLSRLVAGVVVAEDQGVVESAVGILCPTANRAGVVPA